MSFVFHGFDVQAQTHGRKKRNPSQLEPKPKPKIFTKKKHPKKPKGVHLREISDLRMPFLFRWLNWLIPEKFRSLETFGYYYDLGIRPPHLKKENHAWEDIQLNFQCITPTLHKLETGKTAKKIQKCSLLFQKTTTTTTTVAVVSYKFDKEFIKELVNHKILNTLSNPDNNGFSVCGNFVRSYYITRDKVDNKFYNISEWVDFNMVKFLQSWEQSTEPKNLKDTYRRPFKAIVFQILYALYCGTEWFDFIHADLHSGNVMLKYMLKDEDFKKFVFILDKDNIFVLDAYKCPWMVKLIDFGDSKVVHGGKIPLKWRSFFAYYKIGERTKKRLPRDSFHVMFYGKNDFFMNSSKGMGKDMARIIDNFNDNTKGQRMYYSEQVKQKYEGLHKSKQDAVQYGSLSKQIRAQKIKVELMTHFEEYRVDPKEFKRRNPNLNPKYTFIYRPRPKGLIL